MTIPQSKAELLAAIDASYGKVLKAFEEVPAAQARDAVLEGHAKGTSMSVADLLAYLVGWNELVLKWIARDEAGQPIDFPETDFKWNELGRLAQKFYADYAALSYPQLLQRFAEAKAGIVGRIAARDDAALYGRPWCGKWTMGRMIQFNTSSPYDNARGRLRQWRKAQDAPAQP